MFPGKDSHLMMTKLLVALSVQHPNVQQGFQEKRGLDASLASDAK